MKILITGSTGFIGSNLRPKIKTQYPDSTIYEFNSADSLENLNNYTKDCDFVFHLAATHRPPSPSEFDRINRGLLGCLLDRLEKNNNYCPILFTSSIQAVDDTPYGHSKLAAENLLRLFSEKTGSQAIIYRLSNTFGQHARPHSHSVVATFCYDIYRSMPITINAPEHIMTLYYIDDVCNSFISHMTNNPDEPDIDNIYRLPAEKIYQVSVGELANRIKCYQEHGLPSESTDFEKKLFKTYLSYCHENN